ncbi:MAG: NAD-dependent epimerase/dehydratase family protein [Neisseria sp.]|nr:NAD-dependent epimerase/dehydratase family protein [Neisseria sp.]
MKVLLLGGGGFIGRRIAGRLREAGCELAVPPRAALDFLHLREEKARPLLQGCDAVVNCAGVMSRHADVLETVHHHAPANLAQWARKEGVGRWLQLSALGASPGKPQAFLGSKGRGDEALAASGLDVAIGRPSVVYGRGGKSCGLFLKLARMPLLPLPMGGAFDVQPVHADDVAQGFAVWVMQPPANGTVVAMTGSTRLTLAAYLDVLRRTVYGKPPLRVLPLPLALLRPLLPLAGIASDGFLSRDSMALLQEGSYADCSDFAGLLGRNPLAAAEFYRHP